MSNAHLLITNLLDDTTLVSSNTESGYPIDNTKEQSLGYVYRTLVASTTTTITGSITAPEYVNTFAIGRYTFGLGTTVTLELKSGSTVVSTIIMDQSYGLIPLGTWVAGIDPFGGLLGPLRNKIIYSVFDEVLVDNFVLTIDDTAEPMIFDIGRLFWGKSFGPDENISYGATMTMMDDVEHFRGADGSLRSSGNKAWRMANIKFDVMDDVNSARLKTELLINSRKKDMLYILDPDAVGIDAVLNTMICKRGEPPVFTRNFFDNNATQFTFMEV